ncbi:MAG: DNA primase, partial [Lachnospiraceae bacterium]|nr:DNA primase [Lachnospiraceae bacterium]
MYYADDLIEEVRSRNPIQDVVGQYVHLTKKGGNYFGLCPFHNEKTGSFSVSPSKQIYHCFGCGAGGNVLTFIMNYENVSFGEAMEILAKRAGIDLPKQEYTPKQREEADLRTRLLEIHKEAALYYHRILRSEDGALGYRYFRNRGLTNETMISFGLGYT